MTSLLSNDLRAVLAKIAQNQPLSELERVIAWEATKSPEYDEVPRWKRAFREFDQLYTESTLPPVEPVRGGMKCWHGAKELVCTAMDEGGYGFFEQPNAGFIDRLHMDDVTTRSPFGNFVRLRDVPVGATIFWKDSTHWRPLTITSFQEMHVCTLPTRGGNVFIDNTFLDKLVSYFPPEWSGPGWNLNPFTHELYIQIPPGVRTAASEHRTHNQKKIEAYVHATWAIYPGLYYAYEFLQKTPDLVFRIAHFDYTVWTSVGSWAPSYCWTRAQTIPDGAVPACWKHGRCTALNLAASEVKCGWYMDANGVRFTGTNWKVKYGTGRVHIVSRREIRFETQLSVSFENDEDLQAFEDAYTTNSNDYTGSVPETRVQAMEMCCGASSSTA